MPAGIGVWHKAMNHGREVRRSGWLQWSLIVLAVDYIFMLVSMHLVLERLFLPVLISFLLFDGSVLLLLLSVVLLVLRMLWWQCVVWEEILLGS